MPSIDYAPATYPRRSTVGVVLIILAVLAVAWALSQPPQVIVSNRLGTATNEAFCVRRIVDDPASHADFIAYDRKPIEVRSFAGCHYVAWNGWRRNGKYLVIPKPAVVCFTVIALVAIIVLTRRFLVRATL